MTPGSEVRVVDTHTHVVSSDEAAYPLQPAGLPGDWYRSAPCSAEQLLAQMDAAGVAGAVLVQGVGAYSYDNSYAADSAAACPERFASACCIDVEAEDPLADLGYWIGERGMQGVRLFALSASGPSWLAEPRGLSLLGRAHELGAHVIVTILWSQLGELDGLLSRFPNVPISLDHCAFPPVAGPPWRELEPLLDLAKYPNLHLKLSTHVIDSEEKNGSDVQGLVGLFAERFGASRLLWGSDFCQTHDRSYAELVGLGKRAFAGLPEEERALCLGGNALRLWPALSCGMGEVAS